MLLSSLFAALLLVVVLVYYLMPRTPHCPGCGARIDPETPLCGECGWIHDDALEYGDAEDDVAEESPEDLLEPWRDI